ncbi:Alpha/beta hydrolase family protein [Maioricimonas rarisocia]|uniref:Alpha/beta hydrolase family protein n=1 Tax=Maioricimonas rarisocia TaxID=2528026 RepID=A0A517ZE74_9PLAN|nr:alpha/beta fold hydrolase [Maioricimonas rarisocia]QDU40778.1 Alpha/beta hydrolase family protein [Maioricimonas rarisocia]
MLTASEWPAGRTEVVRQHESRLIPGPQNAHHMIQYLQGKLIYRPRREEVSRAASGLPDERVRHVRIRTDDGLMLNGWLCFAANRCDDLSRNGISGPPAQRPQGRALILYCPGTTGHRGHRLKAIQQLTSLGCDVLIVDYRGYAENAGSPSERWMARDARRIWKYATDHLAVPAHRIVIYGESLGGGVATSLAADLCRQGTMPAGLILRSTFTSLVDVAAERFPWLPVRMCMVDRFDSRRRISRIDCPLLIIHGTRDRLIPITHGRELFRAAPPRSFNGVPRRFVELPGAGHDNVMYAAPDRMREAHETFLDSLPLPANRQLELCGTDASS